MSQLKVSGEVLGEDFRAKPGRDGKQLKSNTEVRCQRSRQHVTYTARHEGRDEAQRDFRALHWFFLFLFWHLPIPPLSCFPSSLDSAVPEERTINWRVVTTPATTQYTFGIEIAHCALHLLYKVEWKWMKSTIMLEIRRWWKQDILQPPVTTTYTNADLQSNNHLS